MAARESAIVQRTRELGEAVTDLRHTIEERLAPVQKEPRGYRSDLRRPRALELGLRLCVDVETGDSLAARLKVVPAEYVKRSPDGKTMVRCLCGSEHERAELVECPGGCSRWFLGDESGVWAVKLPEAVEDAA